MKRLSEDDVSFNTHCSIALYDAIHGRIKPECGNLFNSNYCQQEDSQIASVSPKYKFCHKPPKHIDRQCRCYQKTGQTSSLRATFPSNTNRSGPAPSFLGSLHSIRSTTTASLPAASTSMTREIRLLSVLVRYATALSFPSIPPCAMRTSVRLIVSTATNK